MHPEKVSQKFHARSTFKKPYQRIKLGRIRRYEDGRIQASAASRAPTIHAGITFKHDTVTMPFDDNNRLLREVAVGAAMKGTQLMKLLIRERHGAHSAVVWGKRSTLWEEQTLLSNAIHCILWCRIGWLLVPSELLVNALPEGCGVGAHAA